MCVRSPALPPDVAATVVPAVLVVRTLKNELRCLSWFVQDKNHADISGVGIRIKIVKTSNSRAE
jgi:hypothetical protein